MTTQKFMSLIFRDTPFKRMFIAIDEIDKLSAAKLFVLQFAQRVPNTNLFLLSATIDREWSKNFLAE